MGRYQEETGLSRLRRGGEDGLGKMSEDSEGHQVAAWPRAAGCGHPGRGRGAELGEPRRVLWGSPWT